MINKKILVTRRIPEAGIEILRENFNDIEINEEDRPLTHEELLKKVKGKDAVLCLLNDKIDGSVMDIAGPQCKIFSNYAVGYDNIKTQDASDRKVYVTNTPDCLTSTTADMAIALMFACARRMAESDKFCRDGKYKGWGPQLLLGQEVSGKTLGIIGAGRIGTNTAVKMHKGFNMKLVYSDERVNDKLDALGATSMNLDQLLEESDFISVHISYSPQVHHLINDEAFNKMKNSAIIVNTSRGPVIDENALVQALREKKIFAAGLDVFENEPAFAEGLTELSNIVLAPHLGSATIDTRAEMARMAANSIVQALAKEETPEYCVNKEAF